MIPLLFDLAVAGIPTLAWLWTNRDKSAPFQWGAASAAIVAAALVLHVATMLAAGIPSCPDCEWSARP